MSVGPSIRSSVPPFVRPFFCLYVRPSDHPSFRPSVRPSVSPSQRVMWTPRADRHAAEQNKSSFLSNATRRRVPLRRVACFQMNVCDSDLLSLDAKSLAALTCNG